jgi:hypothetical protein
MPIARGDSRIGLHLQSPAEDRQPCLDVGLSPSERVAAVRQRDELSRLEGSAAARDDDVLGDGAESGHVNLSDPEIFDRPSDRA